MTDEFNSNVARLLGERLVEADTIQERLRWCEWIAAQDREVQFIVTVTLIELLQPLMSIDSRFGVN